MAKKPENCIGGKRVAPFQIEHYKDDRASAHEYSEHEIDIKKYRHRDSEQGGMSNSFPEVGKATPNDKASRRSGHQRKADTGDQGSSEEIVQHRATALTQMYERYWNSEFVPYPR